MAPYAIELLCFLAASEAVFALNQGADKAFLGVDSSVNFDFPWEESSHHASPRLQCGITEQVGGHTDKYEDCPANCPYFAQNRKDDLHCTFLCVPGSECGRWNPNKPIPDSIKNSKTCRGPKVAFCSEPRLDGTDMCQKCQSGFALHHDDGQCYFEHWTAIITGAIIFVIIMTVLIAWFVDMWCRTPVNNSAVVRAEHWRSRSKIINPETLRTYDTYGTNLCEQDIAGPGMLLHFRFQRFFIIWPLVCAVIWTLLAAYEPDLFILGTRKFGTPRHNCILVAWGYETQQRLMWTKVLFLVIVYIGSTIAFLQFSVSQKKKYIEMDETEKTMKDFALELIGLPELPATHKDVEKDIKKIFEDAFGKQGALVGVSVAWNYQSDDGSEGEAVDRLCNKDLNRRQAEWELEQKSGKRPSAKEVDDMMAAEEKKQSEDIGDRLEHIGQARYGSFRQSLYDKEKSLLGPDDDEEDDVPTVLKRIGASDAAFIVFNTEKDKVEALKTMTEIEFPADVLRKYDLPATEKVMMTLEDVGNEPANLNWHNFGERDPNAMVMNFLKGLCKVYIPALLIWFFGFYCPYAWSLYNFNYDNGAELPGYYSIIFTIVVCGGNATMYVVCDICCDIIGFRYKDTKQVAYMLMYLCACMINVFLDMYVTYLTAYKVMVGLDFRNYHGKRLADIDVFTEQFETYAMQRSLGGNTYAYAWPSTFFLCFCIEPVVTIVVPYYLGKIVVRTHREIRGNTAEAYMMAFEFDLGRYADILLNVFLGILIFYFPGGYIWTLFYFMCFSHCFIYCFDHYRVLNVIPKVKIVSYQVDWWAQVTMGFCCAVILSCLVFKANCESYAGYCIQGWTLIGATTVAGVAHFIVHFLLLCFLVPKLAGEKNDQQGDKTFAEVAKNESRTWFSSNPIHCLRSKYIHEDQPHCLLASWGKEHLLEENDKIGCYFKCEAAHTEEFATGFRGSIRAALMKNADDDKEEKTQA